MLLKLVTGNVTSLKARMPRMLEFAEGRDRLDACEPVYGLAGDVAHGKLTFLEAMAQQTPVPALAYRYRPRTSAATSDSGVRFSR